MPVRTVSQKFSHPLVRKDFHWKEPRNPIRGGISMPNLEVLDAKIAPVLNRIIHDSRFKKKVSLEEQKAQKEYLSVAEDRSLTWSTSTSGSLEPMIFSRIMPTFLHLIVLRNDDIQEIRFEMGRNLIVYDENPIWRHLGRIVQIKNTSLRNSRPCWNCMTWRIIRRKAGPDYNRMKTKVNRNIEQYLLNRNFGTRNENDERNPVVQNQGAKQRVQRILGDCWQWGNQRAGPKGTIAVSVTMSINVQTWHSRLRLRVLSCNRMRQVRREPEVPEEIVPVGEFRLPCKDYCKGTCTN